MKATLRFTGEIEITDAMALEDLGVVLADLSDDQLCDWGANEAHACLGHLEWEIERHD